MPPCWSRFWFFSSKKNYHHSLVMYDSNNNTTEQYWLLSVWHTCWISFLLARFSPPRSDQGHPVVRTVDSLISWQYCRGHEGCVCTQVHSLTDVCFCFIVFVHRYTPCGEFFLCELNVNPRGFSSYWRVFLTSQLDFLHILLTSSSFLSLVMGRSLFPLKPVSFSISPMQNSQASVVLFVVFKPVFEVFSSCRVIGGTNVLCTRDSENNWSYCTGTRY